MIGTFRVLCVGLWFFAAIPAGASDTPEDFWGPSVVDAIIAESFVKKQDFGKLENLAKRLRDSRQRFSDGKLFVTLFYEKFAPRVNWSLIPNRAILDRWKLRYPDSPTPYLVEAVGRTVVAYGDDMEAFLTGSPPDQEVLDRAELGSVRDFLLAHRAVAEKDPYWFTLMATVSASLGREPAEILTLVDEGLKVEPHNFDLVIAASARFTPERGGDAAKLEAFANAMMERFAPFDGPNIYARIYWQALTTYYKLTLFKTSRVDWTKLKPAIASLVERYPVDVHRNAGALMACLAGDRRMTADLIGDKKFIPLRNFWQDPDALDYCRNWAFAPVAPR